MFPLCRFGMKNRQKLREKAPRVAFVQTSDIALFDQKLATTNVDTKDDPGVSNGNWYPTVDLGTCHRPTVNVSNSAGGYIGRQEHKVSYISNTKDRPNLAHPAEFITPVKVKPVSASVPILNLDENQSDWWDSQKGSSKSEKYKAVITITKLSKPFPSSRETLSLSPKMRLTNKTARLRQSYLEKMQENRRGVSLSPNVKLNHDNRNRGQRLSQLEQKSQMTVSLIPNLSPQDTVRDRGRIRFPEKNLRGFSLSPSLHRNDKSSNRRHKEFHTGHLRGYLSGANVQSPTNQSPMQNQENKRHVPENRTSPSSCNSMFSRMNSSDVEEQVSCFPHSPEVNSNFQRKTACI